MEQRHGMPLEATAPPSHSAAGGAVAASNGASHGSFRHEALFYAGGDDGFLEGTLALVEAAVENDAAVLVAVGPARSAALKEALGERAGQVWFADMHSLGRNPARIIPVWGEFLTEHGDGQPLGIDEPVWPGRSDAELSECVRHESLLNLAFDDGPEWHLLCPYDLDGLDDRVIEATQRTHPVLAQNGRSRCSEAYPAAPEAPDPFAGALPPPSAAVRELVFTSEELAELRRLVFTWAAGESLGAVRCEELVLAVNELTTNSVRYGGGSGTLRLWREREELLCEVHDGGRIEAPLVGRVRPTPYAHSGRGVWIANQLCDLVRIRSATTGTVVRVHMALR
jgi:anti-sigma regulatory factor (Ser/Thr protein kinase)